jgi:hypothetical protein
LIVMKAGYLELAKRLEPQIKADATVG